MKRIKLIALTLVLIICGAFCLTACGKDNSTVSSIDDARSHYGEITDIMLATMRIEEDDQFHAYYKEQVEDLMEELYTSNFDILDPFIEEVVGQSQIKNLTDTSKIIPLTSSCPYISYYQWEQLFTQHIFLIIITVV